MMGSSSGKHLPQGVPVMAVDLRVDVEIGSNAGFIQL
jgi:hypothetical protein